MFREYFILQKKNKKNKISLIKKSSFFSLKHIEKSRKHFKIFFETNLTQTVFCTFLIIRVHWSSNTSKHLESWLIIGL